MFQLVQLSVITLVLSFSVAQAQTAVATPTTAKPNAAGTVTAGQNDPKSTTDKKTTLNFEDELIEGSNQKPDLFYMFQKNNFKFKKLIRLRENFIPEMARNAEDIQRLRGGR